MDQLSLFDNTVPEPLAARVRPKTLDEYVGQEHLLHKVIPPLSKSHDADLQVFVIQLLPPLKMPPAPLEQTAC